MRYDEPKLREHLADAYALGTLRGAARRRFERLMADDAGLRRLAVASQERLVPLALAAPEVRPPERVRRALAAAVARSVSPTPRSWRDRLGFWRGLAVANGALAALLVAFVGIGLLRPALPSELVYVGVLDDGDGRPTLAVLAYNRPFRLEIATKDEPTASPGEELRLWIRAREDDAPHFVATIPPGQTTLPLGEAPWKLLRRASALMITREPAGAPATAPGPAVLYQGVCVNVKRWAEAGDGSSRAQ